MDKKKELAAFIKRNDIPFETVISYVEERLTDKECKNESIFSILARLNKIKLKEKEKAKKKERLKVNINPDCYVAARSELQQYYIRLILEEIQDIKYQIKKCEKS